ncbi:MAG: lipoyl synthase [Actinobacteria bacterium]|nr:lipoyl synthase [Actinomycetota bacterium]
MAHSDAVVSDRPSDAQGVGPGRKPEWLKKPLPDVRALRKMETLLRTRGLHTVCESALCPNLGECFARGTATFLVMGDVCTRDCRFCGVTHGRPTELDAAEPEHIADAVVSLGLRHVVITSVTRDDLSDGGAGHYVAVMRALRERTPQASLELLTPDFQGCQRDLDLVLDESPDVFNHNVETVPRLYDEVRPQADFERSLLVLHHAARRGVSVVKTGWMVGLGETREEVRWLLEEVAGVGVQVVTIGQYLSPSKRHLPVSEYIRPEMFELYRDWGEALGLQVHAAPFVRSSFQAGESFARMRQRRGQKREEFTT